MNVSELRKRQEELRAAANMSVTYSSELKVMVSVADPDNFTFTLMRGESGGGGVDILCLTPIDIHILAAVKQHFEAWRKGLQENPLPAREVFSDEWVTVMLADPAITAMSVTS